MLIYAKHLCMRSVGLRSLWTLTTIMARSKRQNVSAQATGSAAFATSKIQRKEVEQRISKLLKENDITSTITKAGWCLKEGLEHISSVDETGRMLSTIETFGIPTFYKLGEEDTAHCRHDEGESATVSMVEPQNCFQSLCRIVAGQQLAGAAARTIWGRLLNTVEHDLTPKKILAFSRSPESLQKPAGLSRAKASSILALAEAFESGKLSEDLLTSSGEEDVIRPALLDIKGIGPWSCDMFIMFYLHLSNGIPLGDLGVRKGLQIYFESLPKEGC